MHCQIICTGLLKSYLENGTSIDEIRFVIDLHFFFVEVIYKIDLM